MTCGGKVPAGSVIIHLTGLNNFPYPLQSQRTKKESFLCTLCLAHPRACSTSAATPHLQDKRITAWVLRFIQNCHSRKLGMKQNHVTYFTTQELYQAELCLCSNVQRDHFMDEIESHKGKSYVDKSSPLLNLRLFVDSEGLLCVGGRQQYSKMSYSKKHPIILHHKHPLSHLILRSDHLRLLHAGPTLLMASLNNRYHILNCRKLVCSITRGCVICRKLTTRPSPQMTGQLPIECLTPGPVFDKIILM